MNYELEEEHRKAGSFKTVVYCHAPDIFFNPLDKMEYDLMMDFMKGNISLPCQRTAVITPFCGMCPYVRMSISVVNDDIEERNI